MTLHEASVIRNIMHIMSLMMSIFYPNIIISDLSHKTFPSLSIFVSRGIIKSSTVENSARSGLNFEHMKTLFNRIGED